MSFLNFDKIKQWIEYPSSQSAIAKIIGLGGSAIGWSETKSAALSLAIYLAAEAFVAAINFFRSDADVKAKQDGEQATGTK